MKKTFSKFLATAAAVSMLASVSVVANADATFETTTTDAGLIITGVAEGDDLVEITVPAEIDGNAVVGIADFAFADLDNATNIYVPASVKAENTGNCAFMTKKSLAAFIEAEVGADATKDEVIAYVAAKINYAGKTEGFTAEELAEVEAKLMNKATLAGVEVTEDMTTDEVIEAVATVLQNDDAMALAPATADKLAIWETTITNTKVAVMLEEGSDIQLPDDIQTEPIFVGIAGDANNDGVVNVRDAAAIAAALANGTKDELPGNGDFNNDGEVTVRDAAQIAAALANGTIAK